MADSTVRRVIEVDAKLGQDALAQVKLLTEEFKNLRQSAGGASQFLSSFSGAIAVSGAVISGYKEVASVIKGVVGGTIEYAKSILGVQASLDRLKLGLSSINPGLGLEGAGKAIEYVRDVSSKLGVDFNTASSSFLKLSASASRTILEGQGVRDIFETLSKVSLNLGLSNQQVERSFLAVEQMISKGTVQNEELRGQLSEALPGAFEVAARAIGVTTQKLQQMLKNGELITVDFLPKFAAQYEKEFGNAALITDNAVVALNKFQNAWVHLEQSIVNGGIGKGVAQEFDAVSDTMDRLAKKLDKLEKDHAGLWPKLALIAAGAGDIIGESTGIAAGARAITGKESRDTENPRIRLKQVQDEIEATNLLIENYSKLDPKKGQVFNVIDGGVEDNGSRLQQSKNRLDYLKQQVDLQQRLIILEGKDTDDNRRNFRISENKEDALAQAKYLQGLENVRKLTKDSKFEMDAQLKVLLAQLDAAQAIRNPDLQLKPGEYESTRRELIKKYTFKDPDVKKEDSAVQGVNDFINSLQTQINVQRGLNQADSEGSQLTKDIAEGEAKLAKVRGPQYDALAKYVHSLEDQLGLETDLAKQRKEQIEQEKKLTESYQSEEKRVEADTAQVKLRTDALNDEKDARASVIARMDEQKAEGADQVAWALQYIGASQKLIDTIKAEAKAYRDNAAAQLEYADKFDREEATKNALEIQKKEDEETKRRQNSLETSISDALMRGFEHGTSFAQNFRDTVQNILKKEALEVIIKPLTQPWVDAIDRLAQYAIKQLSSVDAGGNNSILTKLFGGAVGSLFGNIGGGQGINISDSDLSLLHGASGYGGGVAAGGPVADNVAYTIGEHGRETFIPASDGVVMPNGGSWGSGGAQSLQVVINNTGTPQRATSSDVKFDAKGAVVSLVLEDIKANGPIAKSMSGTYGLKRGVG